MKKLSNGCIEVSGEDIEMLLDGEYEEVNSSPWRHGRTVTFMTRIEGAPYLFQVDVHHEDGWQVYGRIVLHPAEQVLVPRWVRKALPEQPAPEAHPAPGH